MGREGEGRSEEGGKGKEGWEGRGGGGGPAHLWFKRWSHFFHFGRRFLMGQVCSAVCDGLQKKDSGLYICKSTETTVISYFCALHQLEWFARWLTSMCDLVTLVIIPLTPDASINP